MFPGFYVCGRFVASYGLLIVIGFFAGAGAAMLRAKKFGRCARHVLFSLMYGALGMAAGGKLLFLLLELPNGLPDPGSVLSGGFVLYGGIAGGLACMYIYARQYALDFKTLLWLCAPAFPLMQAFGRIGCFMAGCCWGAPCPEPLGIVFSHSLAAPNGVPLFPVQLLEAGLDAALFAFLWLYCDTEEKPAFGLYIALYGVIRLLTEQFRGDAARGFLFGLSTSTWLSIAAVALGLVVCARGRRKKGVQ